MQCTDDDDDWDVLIPICSHDFPIIFAISTLVLFALPDWLGQPSVLIDGFPVSISLLSIIVLRS